MLELTVYVPAVLFLFQRLALIITVLASCYINVELGPAVLINEQESRHNSYARTLCRILQSVYLSAVQQ